MPLNRAKLANRIGYVHYRLSRSLGVPMLFSNRSLTDITLYGSFLGDEIVVDIDGGSASEIKQSKFEIGIGNPGFPYSTSDVEPVTNGDEITYNGKSYSVGKITKDDLGCIYTLTCTETKRLGSGVS